MDLSKYGGEGGGGHVEYLSGIGVGSGWLGLPTYPQTNVDSPQLTAIDAQPILDLQEYIAACLQLLKAHTFLDERWSLWRGGVCISEGPVGGHSLFFMLCSSL